MVCARSGMPWNPHSPEVHHYIPTPKAMSKAAVSEAIARAWVGQASEQLNKEAVNVDSEDEEEANLSFGDSRKRRKNEPPVYN